MRNAAMPIRLRFLPFVLMSGLLAFAGFDPSGRTQDPSSGSACLAVSDGRGTVRLLWPIPEDAWPSGGWRITDNAGREWKRVIAGEAAALAALSREEAELAAKLKKGLPTFSNSQERQAFFFALNVGVFTRPALARAAGFAAVLEGLPAGRRGFRVQGLTAEGRPTRPSFQSPDVDPAVPTAPPAAPAGLKAESRPSGVALFWTRAAPSDVPGAVSYLVERKAPGGDFSPVQTDPILISSDPPKGAPVFLDSPAPPGQSLAYRVFGKDAFGRLSLPVETSVFHPDHAALRPPDEWTARGEKGVNLLTWKVPEKTGTGKLVILRALTPAGPFLPLTAKGITLASGRFEDKEIRGGLSYFYQSHVLGEQGLQGPRSPVVSVVAKNTGPPASPAGFKAEVQRTRIRLSWTKAESGPLLAGYLIERKDKNGNWVRLNEAITPEPFYDDYGGSEGPARWNYRVRSIALDNQESPPSAVVEVVIPDRNIPPVPAIESVDGSGGKAVLRFRPGLPVERAAQFIVLRSGDPRDPGVVLGRPLPASAREYIDPFVEAGAEYWYRVASLAANGNRSELSEAVLVRVGPPPLPAPPAPKAEWIPKPFPRVRLSVPLVPQGLELVLDRKLEGEADWLRLSETSRGVEIFDGHPPTKGRIQYRIVFRTRSGLYGPPSPLVEVKR